MVCPQQDAAQVVVEGDRRVAGRVHPAGDAGVELAEGDLVRHRHDALQPGRAGHLHVVSGGAGVEPGAQHRLAGKVEIAAVLQHRPGDELAEQLAL